MNRINLEALKTLSSKGNLVYQVPVLEPYLPKLMELIPDRYSKITSKPYRNPQTNICYIDVLCTTETANLVERIIQFCGNTRAIPLEF